MSVTSIHWAIPWRDTSDRLVCSSYSTKRTSKKTRPVCHQSTTSTASSLVSSCVVSKPWSHLSFPALVWSTRWYLCGGFLKWGYPKIIHFIFGCSILNHSFWGTPICGTPHVGRRVHRWTHSEADQLPRNHIGMSACRLGLSLSALQALAVRFGRHHFLCSKWQSKLLLLFFVFKSGVLDVLVGYCCFTEHPEASDVRYLAAQGLVSVDTEQLRGLHCFHWQIAFGNQTWLAGKSSIYRWFI